MACNLSPFIAQIFQLELYILKKYLKKTYFFLIYEAESARDHLVHYKWSDYIVKIQALEDTLHIFYHAGFSWV